MGEVTEISWADATFNPWMGCTKVSPGCQHCYAETLMDKRYGKVRWGPQGERKRTSDDTWNRLRVWDNKAAAAGTRTRVFVASLADVFEDNPQVEVWRSWLWLETIMRSHLDFMLLTKRPENILRMTPEAWHTNWPANVWVGASIETQEYATRRVEQLLWVPASVRFLSCEPLLGPLDLTLWLPGLQWVIVGGESGAHARPMQFDWVRSLRDQCVAAGVPFHFKQWGGSNKKATGRLLDGVTWDQFPEHPAA